MRVNRSSWKRRPFCLGLNVLSRQHPFHGSWCRDSLQTYSDVIMSMMVFKMHNHLFRRRSKKTSNLCVTGLCEGNSPVTGEFPSQRASNAENVSIWWPHNVSPGTSCHGSILLHAWVVTSNFTDQFVVCPLFYGSFWQRTKRVSKLYISKICTVNLCDHLGLVQCHLISIGIPIIKVIW